MKCRRLFASYVPGDQTGIPEFAGMVYISRGRGMVSRNYFVAHIFRIMTHKYLWCSGPGYFSGKRRRRSRQWGGVYKLGVLIHPKNRPRSDSIPLCKRLGLICRILHARPSITKEVNAFTGKGYTQHR